MNVRESIAGRPLMSPDRRKHAGIAALILGVLAAGLYFALRGGPPLSDEQQIRAVLAEGEKAVEAKDMSALMGLVSKDFKMGELNRDRLRFAVGQGFRDYSSIYVTLSDVSIRTQGDSATVTATVGLDAQGKERGDRASNTLPMTFQLKKEPGHRFLILPAENWRVVGGSGFNVDLGLFGF
jgi:ketosteroid isomerase-like protein